MRVGLFIPCYVDQFYPQVGLATVQVLEHFGATVIYPAEQTCCGQPLANVGLADDARPLAQRFVDLFSEYDYVVGPSGSCISMVRNHYADLLGEEPRYLELQRKTYELCEFLVDVLQVPEIAGRFPYRVGIHQGCHGLRELRTGSSSEIVGASFNKTRKLLESLKGIQLTPLERPDECCGFGGTFAVAEEAVSCMMGRDRILDHLQSGAEVLTSGDMSCLMHLEGLIRRDGQSLRVMHVAEILADCCAQSKTLP
ncbi:MAG: (Fe-S)-binding protein [Bythopirellula sp.]|nr:(Fe-S)-binding protein [Bythopirellula sp.]